MLVFSSRLLDHRRLEKHLPETSTELAAVMHMYTLPSQHDSHHTDHLATTPYQNHAHHCYCIDHHLTTVSSSTTAMSTGR
jgi:hypothetical protein